jgi:hypothetical protein
LALSQCVDLTNPVKYIISKILGGE